MHQLAKHDGKISCFPGSYGSLAGGDAIPEVKENWYYRQNSSFQGWVPASLCDELGLGLAIVSRLEAAEDAVGEISIEDITMIILDAA